MSNNRPEGFYSRYLRKLGEQREARGEPPAPDVAPAEYWEQRRRNEALKDQQPKAGKCAEFLGSDAPRLRRQAKRLRRSGALGVS